jgi:putative proteasome-type protease
MTYCVGMMLDKGLVLMSDTRTNSGVDNISVFRKSFTWSVPGERIITIMTAGNLATTQSVISQLKSATRRRANAARRSWKSRRCSRSPPTSATSCAA